MFKLKHFNQNSLYNLLEHHCMKTSFFFFCLDKLNCTRDYTLLFVALDLEELQPGCPAQVNCSCAAGLCGSGYFVQNFSSYLSSSGANFQGAFILDTILNHNTTSNSQEVPANFQSLFPQLYQQISNNSFRGDFLAVIGRLQNDNELMDRITDAFKSDGTFPEGHTCDYY